MWRSIGRLIIFFVFVTLFFSGSTDADLYVNKSIPSNVWAATTLDFSNKDTANNKNTNNLFSISGLIPGGFQVKSVRIVNQGKMKFLYWISVKYISGDKDLFNKLKIKIIKNWVVKYEGFLSGLDININNQTFETEDLVIVLGLDDDSVVNTEKETSFEISIGSNKGETKSGFYVEQQLMNNVTTGVWKMN